MLMMAVVVVVEKMMISSSKCEMSVAWCLNPIMTPLCFVYAGDTSGFGLFFGTFFMDLIGFAITKLYRRTGTLTYNISV